MCKELMDLMKPEFDAALEVAVNKAVNEAVNEAVNKTTVNVTNSTTTSLIRNLMQNMNLDAEQAMKNLGISEKDFPTYLALI